MGEWGGTLLGWIATVPMPIKKQHLAAVGDGFATGPQPVGYDPRIIPMWRDGPTCGQFATLRLSPYRIPLMPGTAMTKGEGAALTWSST